MQQTQSQPTIKFQQVELINLPAQDYAKAKKLVEMLSVGQYCKVTVNNEDTFKMFLGLLTENGNFFSIKNYEFIANTFNVCNTGTTNKNVINIDACNIYETL